MLYHRFDRFFRLRRLLEECDAEVKTAGSVSEALAQMESFKPHIVLSDLAMPVHDGYDLIKRLRDGFIPDGRNVPAIALTAFARDDDRVKALSAGFQAHVAKPVSASNLTSTIVRLVRNHPKAPPLPAVMHH